MSELVLPFFDRRDAGTQLARRLEHLRDGKNVLVLGLLRGGAEIGRTLADALGLPLHPYAVRKIGHPANPEFAIGAIAQGGGTFLDEVFMQAESITFEELEPVIEEELRELRRRKEIFAEAPVPLRGKHIILTDDGAATGATMFAAIEDMRAAGVGRITVALPVAAPDTAERLRGLADETTILATPSPFLAVGQWYVFFPQLTDRDIRALLRHKPPKRTR
ncbi:MAG: phosphoribosyltransferase family protein [Candidatus Peribacteraceae bacterium]|nr:phosphoribosyltransferase family protein [Candidatus Peribacteraceae bacterium]